MFSQILAAGDTESLDGAMRRALEHCLSAGSTWSIPETVDVVVRAGAFHGEFSGWHSQRSARWNRYRYAPGLAV